MLSFLDFHPNDLSPIYQQIIRYVRQAIVAGAVRDGDEIPSRRALSALLGVNPNTVQKAYALLEEQGLIQSRAGAKSCIVLDEGTAAEIRAQLIGEAALAAAESLAKLGLTCAEAQQLLREHWPEQTGGNP